MRIVITGAAGVIGRVLSSCLGKKRNLIRIDKKKERGVLKLDLIKEQKRFEKISHGAEALIHLAWDIKESGHAHNLPPLPENRKMAKIALNMAKKNGIGRVILASSVHVSFGHLPYRYPEIVSDHALLHHKRKISEKDKVSPISSYGKSKVFIERLGKKYAGQKLKVIAVRFGNVTPDNGFGEYPFWLSHRDCCQFIEKCLTEKRLPDFSTFFAISKNSCNPFDISSAQKLIGYRPCDKSRCPQNQ